MESNTPLNHGDDSTGERLEQGSETASDLSTPETEVTERWIRERLFDRWLFWLTTIMALVLRVFYLFPLRGKPLFDVPMRDSLVYVESARDILAGNFWGAGVSFHSAPLYPYFLAAIMGDSDSGLFTVRVAQALLSALTAGFLALSARRLFGRGAAVPTAIMAIAYAPFLFYTGELLEITLTLFFLSITLWLGADGKFDGKRLALIGATLGLAALGKPNLLLIAPFVLIFIGWLRPITRPGDWPWRRGLLFIAGLLVVIAPFTLRNLVVGGDLVLISSNAGINLFIGNNPGATGGFWVPADMQQDLVGSSHSFAEGALKRELKPSEVSRFWAGRAGQFFKTMPGKATRNLARKAGLLVGDYEIPNHYNIYFFRDYYSSLLRLPLFWFWLVLPLSLVGLVFGFRHSPGTRLAGGSLIICALSVVIFFVTSRYRLPMLIWLIPFAGFGVMVFYRIVRGRKWRLLVWPVLILVMASALVHLPLVKATDYHDDWITLGNYWASQEDWEKVAQFNTQALRENGESAVAWQNLGNALLRSADVYTDVDRAEECLWEALKRDPTISLTWKNLSVLYYKYDLPKLAKQCLERVELLDGELDEEAKRTMKFIKPEIKVWSDRGEKVMDEINKRLEANPGNLETLAAKANALGMRLGKYDEALELLAVIPDEALTRFPEVGQRIRYLHKRLNWAREHRSLLFTDFPDQLLNQNSR